MRRRRRRRSRKKKKKEEEEQEEEEGQRNGGALGHVEPFHRCEINLCGRKKVEEKYMKGSE